MCRFSLKHLKIWKYLKLHRQSLKLVKNKGNIKNTKKQVINRNF